MSLLGYAYLHSHLGLTAFDPSTYARQGAVTRVTATTDGLLVPVQVAGKTQTLVDHVLFALKHEGVDMQVLAHALPKVPAHEMVAGICAAPTGVYIRVACFLWEFFNDTELQGLPAISGPTADVFDLSRYITAKGMRNAKWRVNFNGLGCLSYCVTVERTPAIAAAALAAKAGGADPVLLVLPSDHVFANVPAFHHAVRVGLKAAEGGALVTFGIVPTHPETGYGYVKASQALDANAAVPVQQIQTSACRINKVLRLSQRRQHPRHKVSQRLS